MKNYLPPRFQKYLRPVCFALGFAVVGILILMSVRAAVNFISAEPEAGTATGVTVGNDNTASGGKYVKFDGAKPNIVFVLLDDMDEYVFDYMSEAKSLIADKGMKFNNYLFNIPQCCPSRASMLRGQYSHNTHVLSNSNKLNGGYNSFYDNNNESSTMGTWLQSAGYQTAFLGKYLNGYPDGADLPDTHVPVGWNKWFASMGGFYDELGYDINDNGTVVHRGSQTEDYLADVLAKESLEYLDERASSSDPFLLMIQPPAPHKPYTFAARHKDMFKNITYPRSASFNEADVSDKPAEIQALPLLTSTDFTDIDRAFRDRVRGVQAVDEMIADLVAKLEAQGKMGNTIFMVASDNGLHMGEHRMQGNEDKSEPDDGVANPGGKSTAYIEDTRVPLYVRGPGIPAGQTSNKLVGNIDLAPTFADYAGATVPSFVDGRSFAALAEGQNVPWRNSYLVERWADRIPYYGIYTETNSYVRYDTGEREVYDIIGDEAQTKNLYGTAGAPQTLVDKLEARAKALSTCTGQPCRDIEQQPL